MWFYETSGFLDLLLFVAIFSGVFVCFYCRQLNDQLARGPEFDKKTVLVVTAHPDDECMFFSPTILNLKRFSTIHLLCLSTGNHYGLGKTRREELVASCAILGIAHSHVTVIDHSSLPDDPISDWDSKLVGRIITDHVKNKKIQMVVTFDSFGVSGHRNHIAVFKAVKRLKDKGFLQDVTVYFLKSIGMLRKYASLLDLPLSIYSRHLFLSSPNDIVLGQVRTAEPYFFFPPAKKLTMDCFVIPTECNVCSPKPAVVV
ncbi:N-acetylglucosaminyl-phosphatidylinositol de-N-acetylase-like isoform X1 [Acropora millepora]|uniref:N-acetylglucosaminyl-phosphatidylinositol de-N-acetylase-like isoform X1 n=1 Tax=Acropora millepora TaxID=45264 RepID=UPI001CF30531|nr:N-acetylglucosaminyl-phosphatidylinositol de-N-acetylase-like isoform X1 [Acropora millepora]